jgi:uncharacterized RDD family membrane protein YckC
MSEIGDRPTVDDHPPSAATETSAGAALEPPLPGVLRPGSTFGGYQLGRVLGRGGMGVVYEAEDVASGRRVALKILQRRHGDEYDRERFEREGRLAASIAHEHCVYVFAAEEIDGVPAIAMELMQGTLGDRLAGGPMPPAAAVDAALQLIDGLRAAQDAGILHRDVKPSNCFVDGDGVVKIGDFGISRSLRPADETTRVTRTRFAATPAYAPPEQLSGKSLDVRADIYSLGATLYELLTGEPPFLRPDLMALLMAVANETPRAPHVVAPAVPKGLSRIVLRCLAKAPEHRYQTYDALAAALELYASWSPTPATLGRRVTAGLVDAVVVSVAATPYQWWLGLTEVGVFEARVFYAVLAGTTALQLAYYPICESVWGATPGKALTGLTVVDGHRRRPGPAVAFGRTVAFLAPAVLVSVVEMWRLGALDTRPGPIAVGTLLWLVLLALQFSTARRRNGYAALHDLASGTRVVTRAARPAARHEPRRAAASAPRRGDMETQPTRGGFIVLPGDVDGRPGWQSGYDPRLGRVVWIRDSAPGTPAIPASRAALSRHTRLRWLAGRRTDREAWDVYEAVPGQPLARALDDAASWSTARRWLADIARELVAQRAEDAPPLEVERVWVLDTGRAKLLDDPTADRPGTGHADGRAFLRDLAQRLRDRSPAPWPVPAERALRDVTTAPLGDTLARLEAQCQARTGITRGMRLAALGMVMLPALLPGIGMVAAVSRTQRQSAPPELRVPIAVVRALKPDNPRTVNGRARAWGASLGGRPALNADDRSALETFLAFRHRAALDDGRLFERAFNPGADEADRLIVARVRERVPVDPRDGTTAAAHPAVRRLVSSLDHELRFVVGGVLLSAAFMLAVIAAFGLLLAVACRGAVLRLFGFELVTADGTPASRLRVLARVAIAWSPVVIALAAAFGAMRLQSLTVATTILATGVAVVCAGAVYAVVHPMRGLQDRLAGTWIVPR